MYADKLYFVNILPAHSESKILLTKIGTYHANKVEMENL